jgi:putative membrane protein
MNGFSTRYIDCFYRSTACIVILEMFLWTKPLGRKVFGMKQEYANKTKNLAANQGLYNGFLAAGLLWAAYSDQFSLQLFFLGCVFVAGVFGALTVSRTIFWVQAMPAMLALMLLTLSTLEFLWLF